MTTTWLAIPTACVRVPFIFQQASHTTLSEPAVSEPHEPQELAMVAQLGLSKLRPHMAHKVQLAVKSHLFGTGVKGDWLPEIRSFWSYRRVFVSQVPGPQEPQVATHSFQELMS